MKFFANPRIPMRKASDRAIRSRRFRKSASRAFVEILETRELLAASNITIGSLNDLSFLGSPNNNNVTVSFNFGTLTYTINDTVDVINVFNGGTAVVGGSGTNTVTVQGVSQLTFDTGGGSDTFNIQSISNPTVVTNTASGSPNQTVNVGDAAGVQHIQAAFAVHNPSSLTDLTFDDSGDASPVTATLVIDNPTNFGSVLNLAPATLNFDPLSLNSLAIRGGSAGNTFEVDGTPQTAATTLFCGLGDDNVTVFGTTGPLTIQGQDHTASGSNHVTLGGSSAGVQDILGTVNVADTAFSTNLIVDDSANSLPEPNVSLTATQLTGLAPAAINFASGALAGLSVLAGSGGNAFTVNTTPTSSGGGVPTTLDPGSGANTILVLNTSSPTNPSGLPQQNFTVNVQATSTTNFVLGGAPLGIAGLGGNLLIASSPGATMNVTLDDRADVSGASLQMGGFGSGPTNAVIPTSAGQISFPVQNSSLRLLTGTGTSSFTIDFGTGGANPIPTGGFSFVGGGGANTLNLQGQLSAGAFSNEVYQATGPGAGSITLDGSVVTFSGLTPINDTTPAVNYTFDAPNSGSPSVNVTDGPGVGGTQTTEIGDGSGGSPPAFELVNFGNKTNVTINVNPSGLADSTLLLNNPTTAAGLLSMTINTGAGNDTASVQHTPFGVAVAVNSQGGNDTTAVALSLLLGGASGSFAVDGGPGNDTLNVDATGATTLSVSTPGVISRQAGTNPLNYANYEQIGITNAPSSQAVGGPALTVQATEGQAFSATPVAGFSNADFGATPGSFSVTVDWGDGSPSTGGSVIVDPSNPALYQVIGSHTYAEEGTFTVSSSVTNLGETGTTTVGGVPITISTLAGAPSTLSPASSATVTDAPLIAGPSLNIDATQGTTLATGTVLATFTDTDPNGVASDFTATIDWGDGSPQSQGIVVATGSGPSGPTFEVRIAQGASHAYLGTGFFPLAVSIHDAGGASTVVTDHVNVVAGLSSQGVNLTFNQGSTLDPNTVVATFTSGNPSSTPSEFFATIDWGDGTNTQGTVVVDPNGGFDVVGGHTYASIGTFSITVTIEDSFGGSTTAFSTVTGSSSSLVVTNTNDSGRGSLRQVLAQAALLGGGTILFRIPTAAPYIVHLTSPLTVSVPVIIDPSSMLGGAKFVLDGTAASFPSNQHGNNPNLGSITDTAQIPALFDVQAPNCVIRGMGFVHYAGFGIAFDFESGHDVLAGSTVGTDETGTLAQGNRAGGVLVLSAHNSIGLPGQGNTISANGTGIYISGTGASGNTVFGNHIGTNTTGSRALGNELDGIAIDGASQNQVGGPNAGQGNFIAANGRQVSSSIPDGGAGVYLFNGSTRNTIQGNTIGAPGFGNVSGGVLIASSSNNTIGGTVRGAGNTIAGNLSSGVVIFSGSTGNTLASNTIVRNANAGVYILDSSRNTIGLRGAGNNVSGNAFSGVVITVDGSSNSSITATGNVVRYNAILENHQDGVYLLNAPANVIGGATGSGNLIRLNGFSGVEIEGPGAAGNAILGNLITDQTRNSRLSPIFGGLGFVKGGYGVLIQNATRNVVGASGAGNVFRNNELANILVVLRGRPLPRTATNGNLIGTNTFLAGGSTGASGLVAATKATQAQAASGRGRRARHPAGPILPR